MKGHPTPMGVFSIIQKHKLHHSNIYSGAPMPFMQRITWSGIAMHAGALPGYPASHGCIRLPMAFAARMWNWTKMGARVVITPGEITPARFSHPLLAEQKIAPQPQPTATIEPKLGCAGAAKADKAADAGAPVKPAISEASLELRSTVGHTTSASGGVREQTAPRTPAAPPQMPRSRCPMPRHPRPIRAAASAVEAKAEAATAEAEPAAAKPDQIAASDDRTRGSPASTRTLPTSRIASSPREAKRRCREGRSTTKPKARTSRDEAKRRKADRQPKSQRQARRQRHRGNRCRPPPT